MSLPESFNLHFQHTWSHIQGKRILCAVSGGPDSMVMLNLLLFLKLPIGVAHCNFKLRGDESDADEKLVIDYCRQHAIPVFVQSFDTAAIAVHNQTGIQETARKLRYDWFNTLLSQHRYDMIATAHHADDNAETILFHIIRGTGMAGAAGIPPEANGIIRPLLHINKNDILEYAQQNQIPYRIDQSNHSVKYARNKIRHDVFPLLNQINSQAIEHINAFGKHSRIAAQLIEEKAGELRTRYTEHTENLITLRCEELTLLPDFDFWLFELLKPYQPNQSIVQDMVESLLAQRTGGIFLTPTHKLIINRQSILIHPVADNPTSLHLNVNVSDLPTTVSHLTQSIQLTILTEQTTLAFDPCHQYIDLNLAGDLLTIRNWAAGDRFYPLGMTQQKKVSDYLSDKKVSAFDKERILVLENNREIIAIIGHQISNTFKLTPHTKRILQITVK